ncbi:MAG: cell division protein FtsA [Hyphomonadaceae bacterium]
MARYQNRFSGQHGPRPGDVFASLDIGCSKITCLIARRDVDQPQGFRLLGGGRQQSRGFESGAITDMEALERAIRLAVEDAERQAGQRIEHVVLGITGPKLRSNLVSAQIPTTGGPVSARDLKRVHAAALAKAGVKDRTLLSAHPVAYRIDDQDGIRDPRGMHGQSLSVLVNAVSVPEGQLLNLLECVGRAHLEVRQLVPSAVAAGMGALIEDELENGAICIDLGGGVTTAAIFRNGVPAWLGLVPAAGLHITRDIAQGLGTTFAAAERLKTLHGTTERESASGMDDIECPRLGDDGRLQAGSIKRVTLAEIVAPRVEEVFEIMAKMLDQSALKKVLPRRGVLTGGTSQLGNIRETAKQKLAMPIRLARPVAADRLGETFANPAFSTAAGLLTYVLAGLPDALQAHEGQEFLSNNGRFGIVKKTFFWMRENF